jgi:hypothetical protein
MLSHAYPTLPNALKPCGPSFCSESVPSLSRELSRNLGACPAVPTLEHGTAGQLASSALSSAVMPVSALRQSPAFVTCQPLTWLYPVRRQHPEPSCHLRTALPPFSGPRP